MNQVQRINYRIESQTIFELVRFIVSLTNINWGAEVKKKNNINVRNQNSQMTKIKTNKKTRLWCYGFTSQDVSIEKNIIGQ